MKEGPDDMEEAQHTLRSGMDYDEHERTYRMFLKLIKYTIAATAVILILLALLWG